MYVGARKKLLEIINKIILLAHKTDKIVEVTGVNYSKVEELKSNKKYKNNTKI